MPETDSVNPVAATQAMPSGLSPPYFLPRGVSPPDRGALPLSGLTVLLVEDSRFTSDALRLMCHRSGARLRRAETLESARAHLRTYRPDVVIVDLGLPDGCGDGLIEELTHGNQGSVVIGTSGNADGRKTALAAGALGFMEKPVPGLAAFQRAVLRHLPGRFEVVAEEGPGDRASADPLALQDDLAHAADLMSVDLTAEQRSYLSAFLGGLARVTEDEELAQAAQNFDVDEGARDRLHCLVRDRLSNGASF